MNPKQKGELMLPFCGFGLRFVASLKWVVVSFMRADFCCCVWLPKWVLISRPKISCWVTLHTTSYPKTHKTTKISTQPRLTTYNSIIIEHKPQTLQTPCPKLIINSNTKHRTNMLIYASNMIKYRIGIQMQQLT